MESDRTSNYVRNKMKRIQYVNDFRTGQTRVLEKTVNNFAKSANSYFENLSGQESAYDVGKLENTRINRKSSSHSRSFRGIGNQDLQVKEHENNSANLDSHLNIDPALTNERTLDLQLSTNDDLEYTGISQLRGEDGRGRRVGEDDQEATSNRISVTDDTQASDGGFVGLPTDVDDKPKKQFVDDENYGIAVAQTNIYNNKTDACNDKDDVYNDESDVYHKPDVCNITGRTMLSNSTNESTLPQKNMHTHLNGEVDHFKKETGDKKKRLNLNEESRLIVGSISNASIEFNNPESDTLTDDNVTDGLDYTGKSDQKSTICIEPTHKMDTNFYESSNIIETSQKEQKGLISEQRNLHVSNRGAMFSPTAPSCVELTDTSTQTDFVYTSFHEVYSVLCEKCGHKIDMQEILLSLMNYPLHLNNEHLCTDLEENILIDVSIDNCITDNNRTDPSSFGVETFEEAYTGISGLPYTENRDNHSDQVTLDPFEDISTLPDESTLSSFKEDGSLRQIPRDHTTASGSMHNDQDNTLGQNEREIIRLDQIYSEQNTTFWQIPNKQNTTFGQSINVEDTALGQIPGELANEVSGHVNSNQIEDLGTTDQQEQHTLYEYNQALEGFQDTLDSFAYQDDELYNPPSHQQTSNSTVIDATGNAVTDKTVESLTDIIDDRDMASDRVLPPRNMDKQELSGSFTSSSNGTKSVYNPLYTANRTHQNFKKPLRQPMKYCNNKHAYKRRRGMMKDLTDFAEDNSLDLHNVNSDGNCMFSAVVDQLWINGNFYFTPDSLRKQAIQFLRKFPTHKDGTHLDSFLITESWEDYLGRMERNGEWGDHMVLQGVSEVTRCKIIVINSDMIKTELMPWHAVCNDGKLDVVVLGHMGEYHYVSLRPSNWQDTWAIKAKIRLLNEIKAIDSPEEESTTLKDNSDSSDTSHSNAQNQSPEDDSNTDDRTNTNEEDNGQSDSKGNETSENNSQNSTDELNLSYLAIENADLIERSQATKVTVELLDSQGDLNKILTDTKNIDILSGVPLCHFSFYVRQLIEPDDIYRSCFRSNFNRHGRSSARQLNVDTILYGSVGEELDIRVHGCSHHSYINPKILVYKADIADVVYRVESAKNPHSLIVDMENCRPGFLRLQILDRQYFESCDVVSTEDKIFLERLSFTFTYDYNSEWVDTFVTQGIECCEWPALLTSDWFHRERASGWPDSNTLDELSTRPCHIRKVDNSSKECPDILWQFIFPLVETDLLVHYMDENMRYVMRIFKLLINEHISSSPKILTTNHLKTVMLFCCERIPKSVWSDNIGGGIVYLVSTLMECLHKRNLPHYIMESVNLLDGYTDNEVDTLLSDVERIRLFPLMAVNVFAESNYLEKQWIIQSVVDDMHRYRQDRDYLKSVEQTFCPTLLELAKRLTMRGMRCFDKAYTILQKAYEYIKHVEEERDVEICRTFEKFVEPFVYSVDDPIERYFFTNFVDRKLQTSVLEKMAESDSVRFIGNIVEKENNGRFNEFPVPDGSKLDDAEYLDTFSRYLVGEGEFESAAHFLRSGIALAKDGIKSETIDVGEITEMEVKQQIAEKNRKTVDNFSNILFDIYNNLFECYSHMKQPMLFQEFIHDYEELVITFNYPCYYSRLADVWRKLGNEEKAHIFGHRSEEVRQNMQTTQV